VPSKLGRGAASRQVLAITAAFDDALLEVENQAVGELGVELGAKVGPARREVERALLQYRDIAKLRNAASMRATVYGLHSAGLAAGIQIVGVLATETVDASLKSLYQELLVCESTLAPRFKGLARIAVGYGSTVADEITSNATAAYRAAVTASSPAFKGALLMQIKAATDGDELLARLFSPVTVSARGFNRKGVWWSALAPLQSTARIAATESANLIRQSTFHVFNEVGNAHG
jgi:hypothetical protein